MRGRGGGGSGAQVTQEFDVGNLTLLSELGLRGSPPRPPLSSIRP